LKRIRICGTRVVIFLVIAVAGSIIYGFLMAGRIPVKFAALLVIGALLTVFLMIRSLFTRREAEDPGRPLKEDEAPGLWTLAREVAASVGTRPVDEIRVTPGTDMAVYERGSFKERMHDSARRILILGVGTLNGFSQGAFRAVLAHEYGHFLHRDTAGGDVAIRVNNDMTQFAVAMIESNQAVPWNIAFLFLRVYHFIFRRISHGATRLQEVMADWIAVKKYGATAFEEGLTHVIRRGVEFEDIAFCEFTGATNARRSIQNIYELKADREGIIEERINEVINRATTEDDTHPCPSERFRLARRIESEGQAEASGMVWDLIANRVALTAEMNSIIEKQAKAVSGG
jgi:Zn-dependent protease with chaperone function